MLQRFLTNSPEQVSDRVFRFVISDESKDRYGTVIKMNGWNLDNYAKNGIVAYQHITSASNPDYIVGKGKAWVENDRLMGEVEFEPEGTNPIADKLIQKLRFGSINATSVGFDPSDFSYGDHKRGEDPNTLYFRKQELLEWSIVNIPANPNATAEKGMEEFVRMAFEDKSKSIEEIKEEAKEEKGIDEHLTRFYQIRFETI